MSWEIDKIEERISALKKEEVRQFMIAYSELDEKYHGYLQMLPQSIKIWGTSVDKDELQTLQKKYGFDRIYQKDFPYYRIKIPYLGIDGYLAIFNDKYVNVKTSITTEIFEIKDKLVARAMVKAGNKLSIGTIEINKNPKTNVYENIDVPIATAIRKALTYMGIGRFALHKTDHGDNATIIAFKNYLLKQVQPKKEPSSTPTHPSAETIKDGKKEKINNTTKDIFNQLYIGKGCDDKEIPPIVDDVK